MSTLALASLADALAMPHVSAETTAIDVSGYYATGDGGHGRWLASALAPDPAQAAGTRFIAGRWFRLQAGPMLDPRCLGARGAGQGNDTAPIQEGIALGLGLQFSPGVYPVKTVQLNRSTTLRGQSGVIITAADFTDLSDSNILFHITADGCTVEGFAFRGNTTDVPGVMPAPFSHILVARKAQGFENAPHRADFDPIAYDAVAGVRIAHCSFYGGERACASAMVDDATYEDLTIEKPGSWGLAVWAGGRRVIMRGIRVSDCGSNEGIKFGYRGSTRPAEEIILTDFIVSRCGWLHKDPANRQEGVDLLFGAARKVIVANGIIDDCASGGMELKTRRTPLVPDVYQHIAISNLVIRNTVPAKGISLNWTLPKGTADDPPDKSGHVSISNCRISFDLPRTDAPPYTGAAGVRIVGWSDVTLSGVVVHGGAVGFGISSEAAPGHAARRISIIGCRVDCAFYGIYMPAGVVDDLVVSGCEIAALSSGILNGGAASTGLHVVHSRIRQTAPMAVGIRGTGIDVRRTSGMRIEHTIVEAQKIAVYVLPDVTPDAVTRDNWIVGSTLRLGHASDNQVFVRVDAGEDMTLASSILLGPERAAATMAKLGVVCNDIGNQRLVTKADASSQ